MALVPAEAIESNQNDFQRSESMDTAVNVTLSFSGGLVNDFFRAIDACHLMVQACVCACTTCNVVAQRFRLPETGCEYRNGIRKRPRRNSVAVTHSL